MIETRLGTERDARGAAELHVSEISEGFLSTLGVSVLERLYRRVARSQDAMLIVATADARTAGFAAVAKDTSALYRAFLFRDGARVALQAAPRLIASWRRVVETLRYPSRSRDLPPAELLAIAVLPSARGRGVGRLLVESAIGELRHRGVDSGRVVVASTNQPAIGLYRTCGLTPVTTIEVHEGRVSDVLTWT